MAYTFLRAPIQNYPAAIHIRAEDKHPIPANDLVPQNIILPPGAFETNVNPQNIFPKPQRGIRRLGQ